MINNISEKYRDINRKDYKIIRASDNYIEFSSKSTKHLWIISKSMPFIDDCPFVIFHKHSKNVPYYHRHGDAYSILHAVRCITSHDNYVMSGLVKYNK